MKTVDYVGKIMNENITILSLKPKSKGDGLGTRTYVECQCICGRVWITSLESIKKGKTKSCGCLKATMLSKKFLLPNNQGAINEIYRDYERRAKKISVNFNISKEEFRVLVFSNCYYCNIGPQLSKTPLVHHRETDECLSYNGLDRVDSAQGYTIDNCVSCCWTCNKAKSSLSVKEFTDWIKRISLSQWYLGSSRET